MKNYIITDLFKSSWAELDAKQISTVIDMKTKMKTAHAEGFHALAGYCAIMILRALRKNNAVANIEIEQAVDCINDLKFLDTPWFVFPLLNSPLGDRGSWFYIPPSHLKHHTLGQLYWMDSLFSKFILHEHYTSQAHPPTGNISEMFLDEMIAVIYCAPEKFQENLITERGQDIGKIINNYERNAILFTYYNLKEFILDSYPLIFPAQEDPLEGEGAVSPTDSEPMWQNLLFDLSETSSYQGMDRTKRAPMYEALNFLDKKHKEATPKP